MNKMYFTMISEDYRKDRNKLETEVKKLIRHISNRLVYEELLPVFIQAIKDEISRLCDQHRTSKRLSCYEWTHLSNDDTKRISVDGVFQLTFHLVNESPFPEL
jgi:hypothetical protein